MLSVVIPAHNEERTIGACLNALSRQKTRTPFEVIVVDDDSSDHTSRAALRAGSRLHLRILRANGKRRGNARSMGFSAASGDIIASLDADAVPHPYWLDMYERAFRDSRVTAATGPNRIADCTTRINVTYNAWLPVWALLCRIVFGHYLFRGNNFAVRRNAYIRAGGFDPSADALEDIDLSLRVAKTGRIAYLPTTCVLASGRRFRLGLLAGGIEYARTFAERLILGRQTVKLSNVR